MAWYCGIDIGSVYSKGVLVRDAELFAFYVMLSGANHRATAEAVREELSARAGLAPDGVDVTMATGTGAANVQFANHKMSDIVCTARGTRDIFPSAGAVIDVAGQSTKVIRMDEQGLVVDFAVSERCAAGSGQFVEAIANVLRIDLADFGPLSLKSKKPIVFSTGCAVFGESEAVTRVAEGVSKEDIAAGVNKALADKISSLCKKVGLEPPCAICGGGALNSGLVKAVEQALGAELLVPPHPQIVTALGAAVTAKAWVSED